PAARHLYLRAGPHSAGRSVRQARLADPASEPVATRAASARSRYAESGATLRTINRPGSDRLILSTRYALAIGFGSLLLVMTLAGVDGIRVLRQIRRTDDQVRRQFLLRNHVLNDIRSDLYLSGTYVRDYL